MAFWGAGPPLRKKSWGEAAMWAWELSSALIRKAEPLHLFSIMVSWLSELKPKGLKLDRENKWTKNTSVGEAEHEHRGKLALIK